MRAGAEAGSGEPRAAGGRLAGDRGGLAILGLVACTMIWGSNVVVGRAVHADVPPLGLAFWRNTVALLVVLPFTATDLVAQRRVIRANLGVLVTAGVLGTALFNAIVYLALHSTTAINAALTMSLSPLVIPLMAFLLVGERLRPRQAAGITLSLVGVLVILTRGDPSVLRSFEVRPGDLLMLCAMLCWSLYSVLVKRVPHGLGPFTFLAAILAIAVATLFPGYLWESLVRQPVPLSLEAVAAIGYVGAFPAALALLLYNRAVRVLGPSRAGSFHHLVPVFATLLAITFLGEALATFHAVGAGLIAVGLFLSGRWGFAGLKSAHRR